MPSFLRATALPIAVATALLVTGCGGSDDDAKDAATTTPTTTTTPTAEGPKLGPAFDSIAALPGALKTPPPWPANSGMLQQRLRAIGLAPLTEEGQVVHIHQHLDLYVDGDKVTVPANLGIGPQDAFISDLHTHDDSGIMHVESPTQRDFTLGQFFAVWGLPLSATCIGSACANDDRQLRVWVNGKPVSGDPTRIVLAEHQQIVIALGTEAQLPDPIPSTYDFEAAGA